MGLNAMEVEEHRPTFVPDVAEPIPPVAAGCRDTQCTLMRAGAAHQGDRDTVLSVASPNKNLTDFRLRNELDGDAWRGRSPRL